MSPVISVCPRCQGPKPCNCTDPRRTTRNTTGATRKRYGSSHWRNLSAKLIRQAHGTCPTCGTTEHPDDPGSKHTVDLIGGGDHSKARPDQCLVKCRRCHGRHDGARRVFSRGRR